MLNRRSFLHYAFATIAIGTFMLPATVLSVNQPPAFQGSDVFNRILGKATTEKWAALPIGQLMGKIARELEGTPYVAGTLELSPTQEICSVNMHGLDCVTFFETTLDFARMLKHGGRTPEDLLKEVSFTRYRSGKPGDYSTRLHYTTDWFFDNQRKRVVQILSDLPGAQTYKPRVNFMSTHPQSYAQLAANRALVAKIKTQEAMISKRTLKYYPTDKIAGMESKLQTGDIVGLVSDVPGLDIAHTGLIIKTDDGVAHFINASSKKSSMKVTLEPVPISETVKQSKGIVGAMFARPIEPTH